MKRGQQVVVLGMLVAAGLTVATSGYALDRDTQTEVRRLDQRISRLDDQIEQLLRTNRELQRDNEKLQHQLDDMQKSSDQAIDDITRFKNTDIANLVATDKQLATRINTLNKYIEDQTPVWNWGSETRDCKDIGKHQQVQSVQSADAKYTMRFLCFDGRAIHLSTEVNMPPR